MPLKYFEIGQGSRPYGANLHEKVEIFDIFGAAFPPPWGDDVKFCTAKRTHAKKWKFLIFLGPISHPSAPIDVKFCTAKRTQVPVGSAKFDLNRCNESPLRGENLIFGL